MGSALSEGGARRAPGWKEAMFLYKKFMPERASDDELEDIGALKRLLERRGADG